MSRADAFTCGRCGETAVHSLEMVHAAGLTVGRFGSFATDGHGGLGIVSTAGTHQTALSAIAAPPARKSTAAIVLIAALLAFGAMLAGVSYGRPVTGLLAAAAVGGAAYFIISDRVDDNTDELRREYAKWRRTFMCDRCGYRFLVGEEHYAPEARR